VGDILKIVSGRQFPADLILLSSSEPKGMAYIETSNLDGETNLKLKQAIQETANCTSDDEIIALRGDCEAEAPTKHLYEFYGNIEVKGQGSHSHDPNDERRIPIDAGQLLLRGSQLRNTKFIYGLVIYTGSETKLMKNSRQAPLKQSNVEYSVNYQILYMFLALLLLSIISTIGNVLTSKWICFHWYMWGITDVEAANFSTVYANEEGPDILDESCGEVSGMGILKSLMTFLILYNNVVPISLLVTIEVVKYVQAILISFDEAMRHNGIFAKARTSNLNEELGQISYIFTDKTGTLTENIMEFKKCSVGGVLYTNDEENDIFYDLVVEQDSTGLDKTVRKPKSHDEIYKINMQHLNKQLNDREGHNTDDKVAIFLRMMAVCQTVVPERDEHNEIDYQASSPDEAALVKAASSLGFKFINRSPNSVEVQETVNGRIQNRNYRVLHVLEFNSTRKRMSVIVRDENGKIIVFCKGADNVIQERLHASIENSTEKIIENKTIQHLEEFATVGLRTLCFAYCELDPIFYEEWRLKDYNPAATSVHDREKLLDDAYAKIEKDFTLVGASAIEDRLQDQVPETIYKMRQAGISVWMLTGDKQETAINIGFSCKLIDETQRLFSMDEDSLDGTLSMLKEYRKQYDDLVAEANQAGQPAPQQIALIITGRTMKFVFKPTTREHFMFLSLKCKSVICCRVSPSQKADIVKAVRKEVKDSITLAIGDGANDVPMIQSAHIGIGISGQEGLQAANASDYSIAQFKFLQRLLLVHGVCNYWRLVKCILYSFYKNITLYLIELWFAIFNGWSGQILFDRWAITCYNVLFTFWPPIVIGWFERPCEPDKLLHKPGLYRNTQLSTKFNGLVFWKMFLNSIFHSFLLFFLTFLCYSDMDWGNGFQGFASEMMSSTGHVGGYLYIGNFVYTYVIITVLFKISLETSTWTFWNWLAVIGSGFLW
jgi:phospholipid-transporting ATPase